jgi:tetratricopeptide (TPR) repeat protein
MKKVILTCLTLSIVMISMAQNLTKVKDAMSAKKYSEANTMLEEFMKNPKYQKNAELYYLKGKIFSDIAADSVLEKSFPNSASTSLNSFKKAAEMDSSKFITYNTLDGSSPLFSLYAAPYNRALKLFDAKDYEKALPTFEQANEAGKFIYDARLGLSELDTNLTLYTGFSALLSDKEDIAAKYFTKIARYFENFIKLNQSGPSGFDDVYKNLMNYNFNKNNIAEFERVRTQGAKLYPKEEYFTYDEIIFINDIKNEDEKLKRIEAKVASDSNNMDAIQIYSEILFNKLLSADSLYPTEESYATAEAKLVKNYEKMASLTPEDGLIPFNTGLIYINRGFKMNSKISDVNDKIRKFNDAQKPDKAGKIPPPPKELTAQREELRGKQIKAFDQGLPYLLKAQPILEKKVGGGRMELQNYKKLIDILIEVYSSKRQTSKVAADKAKLEAEEAKWNKEYDRINSLK